MHTARTQAHTSHTCTCTHHTCIHSTHTGTQFTHRHTSHRCTCTHMHMHAGTPHMRTQHTQAHVQTPHRCTHTVHTGAHNTRAHAHTYITHITMRGHMKQHIIPHIHTCAHIPHRCTHTNTLTHGHTPALFLIPPASPQHPVFFRGQLPLSRGRAGGRTGGNTRRIAPCAAPCGISGRAGRRARLRQMRGKERDRGSGGDGWAAHPGAEAPSRCRGLGTWILMLSGRRPVWSPVPISRSPLHLIFP